MNCKTLLCLLLFTASYISGEHITLIAPHFAYKGEQYLAYISTSELSNDATAVITFRGREAPIIYNRGNVSAQNNAINFNYVKPKLAKSEKKKTEGNSYGFDLSLLVFQNNMCKRQRVVIKAVGRKSYVFIQMDKPIYKPRDKVQFRVICLDSKGLPYIVNSILVQIFDFEGIVINEFKRHQDMVNGIYQESFDLGDNINIGDYKIRVILDGRTTEMTEKIFPVQKYTLPFFQVHINVPDKMFFEDKDKEVAVFGKYSFGEYVKGNMKLKFHSTVFKYEEPTQKIFGLIKRKLDFGFRAQTKDIPMIIEAELTDSASGTTISANKTIIITFTKDYKIDLFPRFPFEPGLTYHLDAVVSNWNGLVIGGSSNKVTLKYKYNIKGNNVEKMIYRDIKNTKASFKIRLPKEVKSVDIEVSYLNSKTTHKISEGTSSFDAIQVFLSEDSTPNPTIGDALVLQIESTFELGTVIVLFTGRFGIVFHQNFNCYGQNLCKVLVTVEKDMLPAVDVHVYNFESKSGYLKGKMSLDFDSFGENFVDISLSTNTSSPGAVPGLTLNSKPGSTVGLLAFDKSLTFLKTGNDLNKTKIIKEFTKLDPEEDTTNSYEDNYVLKINLDNMSKASDKCSPDDLKILKDIRPDLVATQEKFFTAYDTGKEVNVIELDDVDIKGIDHYHRDKVHLRKNFAETWIFDMYDIKNRGSIALEYKLPDTITSWLISAFAMNPVTGFALAKPQELIVIQEFFIKTILPYSIRFGEVLRLEIVVFNMIPDRNAILAGITVIAKEGAGEAQFEFVKLTNPGKNCEMSFSKANNQKTNVKVLSRSGNRVEFFIRPLKTGFIKIRIDAATKDGVYKDKIEKELLVESEGIAETNIRKEIFDFQTHNSSALSYSFASEKVINQAITAYSLVTGNLMENVLKYRSDMFKLSQGCGEQRMSAYARTLYQYKHLLAVENVSAAQKREAKNKLSSGVQGFLKYRKRDGGFVVQLNNPRGSTWMAAYAAKLIGQGMDFGGVPKSQSNQNLIKTALEYCKKNQEASGSFEEVGYSKTPSNPKESSISRKIRFTSFVTLSFLINQNRFDNYGGTIKKALEYISEHIGLADNYAAALSAYTLSYAGRNESADLLINQLSKNVERSKNHWRLDKNKSASDHTKVLISSYALMAYLKRNKVDEAKKIEKWLRMQRDPSGRFTSSHDTAIALEALAQMAEKTKTKPPHFDVTFEVPNRQDFVIHVNESNANKAHLIEHGSTRNVDLKINGIGSGTVYTVFEYFKNENSLTDEFKLLVTPTITGNQKSTFVVKTCVEYTKEESGDLIMIDYALPSGYVYDKGHEPKDSKGNVYDVELKRADSFISLTLGKIKKGKYCTTIKAIKLVEVKDIKKASVKVYQYDAKEKFAAYFYTIRTNKCV